MYQNRRNRLQATNSSTDRSQAQAAATAPHPPPKGSISKGWSQRRHHCYMCSTMAMMSSFSQAQFNVARRLSPSPYFTALGAGGGGGGGFMIASTSSGLQWHVIDKIRGCLYGEVLRAMEVSRGGFYAIKQMSLERISSMAGRQSCEDPLQEVAILQFLKAHGSHPNVIEVVEVLRDEEYIYVVLPFCNGGELYSAVSPPSTGLVPAASTGLNEDVARPIIRGLLAGMAFLHGHQICHRDVSLENIVLSVTGEVKIIDFGLALRSGQHRPQGRIAQFDGDNQFNARSISPTGPFGKKHYMPPEVAMNEEDYNGFAVDVWALGVVMFITLAGIPPFHIPIPARDHRCHVIAVERRLLEVVRRWELTMSDEAVSLIQACLLFDPSERSTVRDLQNHPWLMWP
ncbi:unnamed protein product [Ectocarpus sp. 6 AP-2014]